MKHFIIFIIAFVSCSSIFAQQKGERIIYANWSFGPTLNTKFVNQFSVNGANIGYSTFIKDDIAIGGELAWANYYQYAPRKTYLVHDGAYTTDMYKAIFTMPVTVTATKYFRVNKFVTPYAKLGLGAMYSQQSLYYNVYETDEQNWGFTVVPELGANIKFKPQSPWAFNVSAQYKYATNKHTAFDVKNIQTLHFNVGAALQLKRL